MKFKKWYIVMERNDGITEQLNVGEMPSFIASDIQQYINEIEIHRNEFELQKQMEAI
jgi:hypothetical protein